MTLRIVDMYQRGELDASVAMQLLGSGVGAVLPETGDNKPGGVKRSRDGGDTSEPEPNKPDEEESLDELLDQAKPAKMETLLHFLGAINIHVKIY